MFQGETYLMRMTSKRRGPKPACPWEDQLEVLKEYANDIFYEGSDKVKEKEKFLSMWKAICKKLAARGFKISEHTIQSNVSQDRKNLKKDLLCARGKHSTNSSLASVEEHFLKQVEQVECVEDLTKLQAILKDALIKPKIIEFSPFPFSLSSLPPDVIKLMRSLKSRLICVFGSIGSLIEKVMVTDEYTSQIVDTLCLGNVMGEDFTPLAHLLTETESKPLLVKFLTRILQKGFPSPAKIILDYKKIHVEAVIESVNTNYHYEKYLVDVFSNLLLQENFSLPRCQVSVDPRMLLLFVKTWNFQPLSLSEYLQDFFIDAFCLLHLQTSIVHFGVTLKNVFTLTLSKFQNDYTTKSFNELQEAIARKPEINNLNNNIDASVTWDESIHKADIDLESCEPICSYLIGILQEAALTVSNDASSRTNPFFSRSITENILKVAVEFPVWSKVADQAFGTLDLQSPMSVLLKYRNELQTSSAKNFPLKIGDCLLEILSHADKTINNTVDKDGSNSFHMVDELFEECDSFLTCYETWMGLNESGESDKINKKEHPKEENVGKRDSIHELIEESDKVHKSKKRKAGQLKKRGPLLEPCEDFFLFMQLPKRVAKKRSIIKNCNRPDVIDHKLDISFVTSSLFDSCFEVLTSSYYLVNKFQLLVDNSSNDEVFLLLKQYASKLNFNQAMYTKRAELLSPILNRIFRNKYYWEGYAAQFISNILTPSIEWNLECISCQEKKMEKATALRIIDISILQNALNDIDSHFAPSSVHCESCGSMMYYELSAKDYLIFDVEESEKNPKSYDINSLPLNISVASNKFVLTGVISFELGLSEPYTRHYVAHCVKSSESRTGTRTWTIFDDSAKRPQILKKKKEVMVRPSIFFYCQYKVPREKGNLSSNDLLTNDGEILEDTCDKQTNGLDGAITLEQNEQNNDSLELDCGPLPSALSTSSPKSKEPAENISQTDFENNVTSAQDEKKIEDPKKNILQIDLNNVYLPPDEKDKTKFTFEDIDACTLSWIGPLRVTDIIDSAANQSKIRFELNEITLVLKFKNTCAFDSIFESLQHATRKDEVFRRGIETAAHSNRHLEALINYCTDHIFENLYLYRAKAMFIRVPTYIDQFYGLAKDCQVNLCSMFKDIMEGLPSFKITGTCQNCHKKRETTGCVTSLNYKEFFSSGISNISEIHANSFSREQLYCTECGDAILEPHKSINSYIAYDLELMYESLHQQMLSESCGMQINNYTTNLESIPTTIEILDKQYSLRAVIAFSEITLNFMHYVAYCRSSIGNRNIWTKYNDGPARKQQVDFENQPPIKIALLLYTVGQD